MASRIWESAALGVGTATLPTAVYAQEATLTGTVAGFHGRRAAWRDGHGGPRSDGKPI